MRDAPDEPDEMLREKSRAAGRSVAAGGFLTVIKLAAALATGSLGLLAEAAHSALDFGAAIVTWVAVRTSWRPPDADHQYGHGKIENLAALIETLLLVVTSVWILGEAVERIAGGTSHVHASWPAFLVVAISIGVDVRRSRDLARVAKATNSQALEADALHFSTDIASSAVVFLGLLGAWGASRGGPAWMRWADPIAAILVAAFVLLLSWRLGRRAVDMLLDRAPDGVGRRIHARVSGLPELVDAPRVRVRQAGDTLFADVEIALRPGLPIAEADRVSSEARALVKGVVGDRSSVFVQVRAVADDTASIHQRVAEAVAREGLAAHNITLRRDAEGGQADLHLELPGHMTLREGHAMADRVEARILSDVSGIDRVDIHLELHDENPEPADRLEPDVRDAVEARVREIARGVVGEGRVHDLLLRRTPSGLYLSCHCFLPPRTPLAEAHAMTDRLELALRAKVPELARVAVHAEPEGTHD